MVGMKPAVSIVKDVEEFDQSSLGVNTWVSCAIARIVTEVVPHAFDVLAVPFDNRDVVDQWLVILSVTKTLTTAVRSLVSWHGLERWPAARAKVFERPSFRRVRVRSRPRRYSLGSSVVGCPCVSRPVTWFWRVVTPRVAVIVVLVVVAGIP